MKCQETKSRWIRVAREDGAAGIILYHNEKKECYCLQVKHRTNMSKEYTWLEDEGYTVIEEIFL